MRRSGHRRHMLSALILGMSLLVGGSPGVRAQSPDYTLLIGDVTTVERIGAPAVTYQRGRDLAAGFIDMAGGVMGSRRLKVVSVDPNGKPDAAVEAVEALKRQGAVIIVGGMLSDVTLAAARAADPMPFLAVDARLPAALVKDLPNLFQIGPSAEALGRALAGEAALGDAVRWGVIAQDDYYGRALAHAFWDELRAVRPDIELAMEAYVPTLSADVGPALDALTAHPPDGLLLGLRHGDLVAFTRAASEGGQLDSLSVLVPQLGTPELLRAVGDRLTEGWVTTGYPCCEAGGQPNRAFSKAYREADPNGGDPTLAALYGYTVMTTVATTIDTAWSTDPKRLTEELRALTLSTPLGEMRFSNDANQAGLPLWIGRIEGGRFVGTRPADPAALSHP